MLVSFQLYVILGILWLSLYFSINFVKLVIEYDSAFNAINCFFLMYATLVSLLMTAILLKSQVLGSAS